jgi:hypothetical protein
VKEFCNGFDINVSEGHGKLCQFGKTCSEFCIGTNVEVNKYKNSALK